MNKKGFTLIEVIISITLLSIVMTSMLASLVKLRDAYSKAYVNVDAVVFGSSVARFINNDLNKNGGIRYINCDNAGTNCDIYLANDQKRKIEILNTESGKFFNIDGEKVYCEIEPLKDKNGNYFHDKNGKCICEIERVSTTLKYTDTSASQPKLLFIKTIGLDKNNKYKKEKKDDAMNNKLEIDDIEKVSTTGYIFGKLSAKSDGFKKPTNPTIRNIITSINIPIYDGVDRNDSTYNIQIYTDASYSTKLLVGEDILIRLNSGSSSNNNLGTITEVDNDFIEKYGIGFYKYNNGIKKRIESIEVPKADNYTFEGYYYNDVKIIDENGKILVNSDYFIDEYTLNAKWIPN